MRDTAIVVTSFERPRSLRLSLLSLALQDASNRIAEIVVADDGSQDSSRDVVEEFASQTQLPVTFVTHTHEAFQAGRARNEAALVSSSPYLAFVDGDCVLPANFLSTHLEMRRPGVTLCGESYRLLRAASSAVDEQVVREQRMQEFVGSAQRRRIAVKARRDLIYSWLGIPMRPRLTGNHFSLWRSDLERIDGFDLGFRGWGLEDHDLQRRLVRSGIRCRTVLNKTVGYHLWHPPVASFVRKARGTHNEAYYQQPLREDARAHRGLSSMDPGSYIVERWDRRNEDVIRAA